MYRAVVGQGAHCFFAIFPEEQLRHSILAFAGRDIFIEGGKLVAARDIMLDAGRDLTITAAKNTWRQQSSSSNQGANVGVGVTGWNITAYGGASAGSARARGDGTSYTNALVAAGGTLSTTSGNDTNVKGANLMAVC